MEKTITNVIVAIMWIAMFVLMCTGDVHPVGMIIYSGLTVIVWLMNNTKHKGYEYD